MRVTIARRFFYLQASEVEQKMNGVTPEPVTTESVRIGGSSYPVKQVGRVVTGQDPRDFSAGEMVRALRQLGFTCEPKPVALAPAPLTSTDPLQNPDAPWGGGLIS